MSTSGRWKYQVVVVKGAWTGSVPTESLQAELSAQGGLGWELVNMHPYGTSLRLVFKRPA